MEKSEKEIIKKEVEHNHHGYISVTYTLRTCQVHNIVLDKMRKSCLDQLKEDREVTGFLEYRHACQYDSETRKEIENEQSKEVDACYDLCALGVFDTDDDSWNLTFIVAKGIDWTTL